MGDGVKVPESERPPVSVISQRLDERVSRKLQNIFVQDIQNDCTCSVEVYDSDNSEAVVCYTSPIGIMESSWHSRLPLPMKENISEEEILSLLETASQYASDHRDDLSFVRMLHNPKSDLKKLWKTFEKYCSFSPRPNYDLISASFVPEDCVYFLPDPEFFGAISVNIDKFGAFCLAPNMVKKFLIEE